MDIRPEKVKSTDKLNFNLNEEVKLDVNEELDYYKKTGFNKESLKHMGKGMLQGSIDGNKPGNVIESKFNSIFLGLCLVISPVGLVWAIFKIKSGITDKRTMGIIGAVIAVAAMIFWCVVLIH